MEKTDYIIKLKMRLLPFLNRKAVSDILEDYYNDSCDDEKMLSGYGEPKHFAYEIKKTAKDKNYGYIIKAVLLTLVLLMSVILLRTIPLWMYSLIVLAELCILFLSLTMDYLLPFKDEIHKNEKIEFIIVEAILLVIGLAAIIFMSLLPSFIENYNGEKHEIGGKISAILSVAIVVTAIVFGYSVYKYIQKNKLWFGGALIQTLIYIIVLITFISHLGNYVTSNNIEECPATFLVSVALSLIYYKMRIVKNKGV
jgi:hypothetical protein